MKQIDTFLSRLENVKPAGRAGWTCRCPAHDDKNASLSVREAEDGKILVKCFAGCRFDDIVRAAGMTPADMMGESKSEYSRGSYVGGRNFSNVKSAVKAGNAPNPSTAENSLPHFAVKDESLSPAGRGRDKTLAAEYEYIDGDGALLCKKQRYSDKSFLWLRPDGRGGWIRNRQGCPHEDRPQRDCRHPPQPPRPAGRTAKNFRVARLPEDFS